MGACDISPGKKGHCWNSLVSHSWQICALRKKHGQVSFPVSFCFSWYTHDDQWHVNVGYSMNTLCENYDFVAPSTTSPDPICNTEQINVIIVSFQSWGDQVAPLSTLCLTDECAAFEGRPSGLLPLQVTVTRWSKLWSIQALFQKRSWPITPFYKKVWNEEKIISKKWMFSTILFYIMI